MTGGALFCCVPGSRVDGHDLAAEAVERAQPRCWSPASCPSTPPSSWWPTCAALGPVSARSGTTRRRLTVVGVTGTAGKSTVTHLVAAIFAAAGRPCGVIGTLSGPRTTPEAPELQARLAELERQGDRAVAMEVSSTVSPRAGWTARFAVAAFTNLSLDHLDYHGTMDDYFAAKARLFTPAFTDRAVICTDDRWGRRLLAVVDENGGRRPRLRPRRRRRPAARRRARPSRGGHRVDLALAGRFNARNAVGAARVAAVAGIAPDVIARGLSSAARGGTVRDGRRRPALHRRGRLLAQARRPRPGAADRRELVSGEASWPSCSAAAAIATAGGRSWARWRPGWPTRWS